MNPTRKPRNEENTYALMPSKLHQSSFAKTLVTCPGLKCFATICNGFSLLGLHIVGACYLLFWQKYFLSSFRLLVCLFDKPLEALEAVCWLCLINCCAFNHFWLLSPWCLNES